MRTKQAKICIITTVHPPFDRRVFHKEAKTLSAAGFNVSLIAQNEKDETVDFIRILSIPKTDNRILRMAFEGFFALRRALSEKFDLYHFHDPELIPWMLLLKAISRKPVIFDMHEIYADIIVNNSIIRNLPSPAKTILSGLYILMERLFLPLFDRIIVTENQQKAIYARYKPVIIANYPILDYFTSGTAKLTSDSIKTIIYAGALAETYGLRQIVKAVGYIKPGYNIRLRLLGPFPYRSFESELKSEVKTLEQIEIIGAVPHDQVAKYLDASDIALVCSLPLQMCMHMGSNKMYEYMAAGLPIVASNFPVWKEFVEKNCYGVCADPLDPRDIAEKIMFLLDNPSIAERMGKNGRRAVQEKYNWEIEGKKLVAVYNKLLG